jgi:hypothetical protein
MVTWSSIRDFYRRWKPEIDLYGVGFVLLSSALVTKRYAAGCIVLAVVLILDAMRRWGEPWRQLGEKEIERRRLASQERWQETLADLKARFSKQPPPLSSTTRVIPAPPREDDLPESPPPIVEAAKPPAPIIPPVTHDT